MSKDQYHHGDLKNALIEAGIAILNQEGLGGLSLRSAAQKVGVSHSAPYAHFPDKQALVAAISTKGLQQLGEKMSKIVALYQENPKKQLYEIAWAYVEFALNHTGLFKAIFSSAIEREHDYPDFVEISHQNFNLLLDVVINNQNGHILNPGAPDLIAVGLWSMVHGFVFLYLERQIPSVILDMYEIKALLNNTLDQFFDLKRG